MLRITSRVLIYGLTLVSLYDNKFRERERESKPRQNSHESAIVGVKQPYEDL